MRNSLIRHLTPFRPDTLKCEGAKPRACLSHYAGDRAGKGFPGATLPADGGPCRRTEDTQRGATSKDIVDLLGRARKQNRAWWPWFGTRLRCTEGKLTEARLRCRGQASRYVPHGGPPQTEGRLTIGQQVANLPHKLEFEGLAEV